MHKMFRFDRTRNDQADRCQTYFVDGIQLSWQWAGKGIRRKHTQNHTDASIVSTNSLLKFYNSFSRSSPQDVEIRHVLQWNKKWN